MPTYDVDIDGKTYEVDAPDDKTAWAWANQTHQQAQKPEQPQQPQKLTPSQQAAKMLDRPAPQMPSMESLGRQAGLTARYGIEGAADAADFLASPFYAGKANKDIMNPSQLGRFTADKLGLPSPNTPIERVVGDASRLLVGGGGMVGLAGKAAAIPGVIGKGAAMFAANPGQQISSLVGAGLGGGTAKEMGGGGLAQFGGALGGGLLGGIMSARSLGGTTPSGGVFAAAPEDLDSRLKQVFQQRGIDFNSLSEQAKQSVREEALKAMQTSGGLNAGAITRLADFKELGIQPTVGQLTRDPVQYSRELNLRGVSGAEPLQYRLNEQAQRLMGSLDEMRPVKTTPYEAGLSAIKDLSTKDAELKAFVDAGYTGARESAGLNTQLNNSKVTNLINDQLDSAMVGDALPGGVRDTLNKIAKGDLPFTVQKAKQIIQSINGQNINPRSREGLAVGIVKRTIDDEIAQTGTPAAKAFNAATGTARERFAWHDSVPAAKAVVEGTVTPDDFVKQFVLNAKTSDIKNLMMSLGKDQREELKAQVISNFAKKAGEDASGELSGFAQKSFNNEIDRLGKERLTALLGKDGYEQVSRIGRVAAYIGKRPPGESVNESKTAAVAADYAMRMMNLPGLRPLIGEPIENILRKSTANRSLDIQRAIAQKPQGAGFSFPPSMLLAPGLLGRQE